MGVLGEYTLSLGAVSTRPQKALRCAETRHVTYRSLKSDHGCRLGAINSDSQCFCMGRTTPKIAVSPRGIWTACRPNT